MKSILFSALMTISFIAMSQNNDFIDLDAQGNSIRFKPIIHASMVLEINHKVLYVDPWGDMEAYNSMQKADYILITDIHPDHYSKDHIESLFTNDVKIIAPQAVYDMMPQYLRQNTTVLANGGSMDLEKNMMIEAIPMYNLLMKRQSYWKLALLN